MKTVFFTIIILLLSANIYAAEPSLHTNTKTMDFGKQLEQTIFKNNSANKRYISNYDHDGNLTERTVYNWIAFRGWVAATKLEYSYNGLNEIASITYLSWNIKKSEWDNKKVEIAYYTTTGNSSIFLVEKSK